MNFLASSAKELGDYIVESEYDLVRDEFIANRPTDFQEFMKWIRGYMYYHAVYCVCGGVTDDVVKYLRSAYDDLVSDYNDYDEMIEERIVEIEDPIEQWAN